MKNLKMVFTVATLLVGLTLSQAFGETLNKSATGSVGVFSNYVWRGQKLSNSVVVQPSVELTYGNFNMGLWANLDPDYSDELEHTETDLTLEYDFSVDKLSISTGYIYYGLEGVPDTQEVYLSVAYESIVNPSLTVYYDFDEGDGVFIVASIGKTLEFPTGISLELAASASYNYNNKIMGLNSKGNDFSDFYNGEVSAALNIPVAENIAVAPTISYSFPLTHDAEQAIESASNDGDSEILYGGLNISLSL